MNPQHWNPAQAGEIREGSLEEVMPVLSLKKLARHRGICMAGGPGREQHVKDKKGR